MTRYVLGFVFDLGFRNVLLIEKARPPWQAGRLNGLGGKIEGGESPRQAMRRELCEETAGRLGEVLLVPYGRLRGPDLEVWLFWGRSLDTFVGDSYRRLAGIEVDEEMTVVLPVADLSICPVVPNLRYLVPMALNHARGLDQTRFFEVVESEAPPEVGT